MEDHYETLPATRDTDDHIYLELMNNSKPKLPPNRLKSIENLVVKEMQYKDKKTRNSVTTQSLENVILPTSNASHVNTKINKRVLIGICVAVVVGCLVVGMTVGILVSSSKTEEHEANKPCGLLKDGWKNFKGHYYIFITTVKTWENAEEDCRYFGARLAEVQSRDEGQWLKNQARRKGGDWWLGASDEANKGQWHWTSGNTLEQYTNWAPNKPDNNYGQDYLQMWAWANFLWDDQTCTNKINYICEKSSC
ncbi:unnamed protein product [Mytilus coruscus]|uniref:C-type lectin domain-containing protein n=1 Tax=Mytilus coruscus TaxID=42192 RepID=A0A6J8DIA8_MYTCO|nr:unnamed protein product [Mytilus coruscus]